MAFLESQCSEELWSGRNAQGHRHRDRGGRIPGPGRAFGLRQVDPAEHDRGARDQSPSGRSTSAGATSTNCIPRPRHRHGVPVLRALPEHERGAEHRLSALEMRERAQARARGHGGGARSPEMLQIEHLLDRKPGQLSGGQRQRVAMGRALVREPQRLPVRRAAVQSRRQAARRDARRDQAPAPAHGTTIVYVTHDQIEAMTLGDRIAVMQATGRCSSSARRARSKRPGNRFVAEFMGSPAMNMMPAEVARGEGMRLAQPSPAPMVPDFVLGIPPTVMRQRWRTGARS